MKLNRNVQVDTEKFYPSSWEEKLTMQAIERILNRNK